MLNLKRKGPDYRRGYSTATKHLEKPPLWWQGFLAAVSGAVGRGEFATGTADQPIPRREDGGGDA